MPETRYMGEFYTADFVNQKLPESFGSKQAYSMKKEFDKSFQPQITAFYCIYCGYMAADTAGALHIQYPANVKFVRMPCTGKTDARYLLEAFEQGADGVY